MKKVFIIHGFNSNPSRNWFPWLLKELKQHGISADVLSMPNSSNPVKEDWVNTIKDVINNPNEDVFLVGHSLGVPTILRYLESLSSNLKIGGAILVSGPINKLNKDRYISIDSFLDNSFDFKYINNICKNFIVIHGTDDHIVPFADAEELSRNLSCKLIPITNGKHLNDKNSFLELPEVLDSILKMININN